MDNAHHSIEVNRLFFLGSPFPIWLLLPKMFPNYLKLSHEALNLLHHDYHDWIAGKLDEKTLYIKKDLLDVCM